MRRGSWFALAVAGLAAVLLAGRAVSELFVDRAWFSVMHAEPVFWEQFTDSLYLRGGLWFIGALFAFLNLYAVRTTIADVAVQTSVANIPMTALLPARRLFEFALLLSVLVGLLLTIPFDDWTSVALVRHGVPFREIENYFERDLGFYVYWLPLEETLYVWALMSVVVMIAIVVMLYALTRSLRLDGRRVFSTTHARRHLTVLGVLIMLLLAWSYRLDGYDLLRFGSGNDGTFLRVDHVVTLKVDFILGLLSMFAAVVLLRAGWMGHARMATVTLSVVLLGAIGVRHGLPVLLANGSALGNPVRREADYIAARALVSRRAYDVDGMLVTTNDSAARASVALTLAQVPRAVGVWDIGPLTRALGPANDSRLAVAPLSWFAARDGIEGLLLQKPATSGTAWTLVSVNGSEADDRGAPLHDGTDVTAPTDSASMIVAEDVAAGAIAEPLIAPEATGHRLVIDTAGHVIGARLESLTSRIAYAWDRRDPRLLARNDGDPVPTLVMWRDVRERVQRLAPVFAQGDEIVPLLHEGTLYWTIELYSASDTYPLSQRFMLAGETRSYFKHAATALVDSRTGRVQLVRVANPDPIARTWMSVAPALFVLANKLPASLVAMLPPPTDGVIAQTRAFARYGSRLDGETVRHFPDSAQMSDAHAEMVFGSPAAIGWTVPLLDGPEQFAGIAVAIGGARRGARWVPVAKTGLRWGVLAESLRAALDSTRMAMAEGGKREPSVSYGRVRTVPIDGLPVMVQPLYVTRLNGTQSLARVAVYAGNAVAVGSSTAEAVRKLLGPVAGRAGNNGAGNQNVPLSAAGRQAVVVRLYDTMRAAMRRGDWARFGTAFDSLGAMVGRPPL